MQSLVLQMKLALNEIPTNGNREREQRHDMNEALIMAKPPSQSAYTSPFVCLTWVLVSICQLQILGL